MKLDLEDDMKKLINVMAVGLAFAGLTACQPKTAEPPVGSLVFSSLGGTSWQLVEIQSMDDSQGTMRPNDPSKYRIDFDKEGTLEGNIAVQLDCNRGVGAWSNPISNATGGTLTIGPLGVTKMLCPPPSMGEMLEKNLGYVRSFVIRDGRLYMSMMADGGIIVWEPARAK
jgi:heat shock protein HslJ